MRTIRFAVAALCTLLATVQVALGAYLCRDEKGVTSYQDMPCPELKVSTGVVPVRAAVVDQRAMTETLHRLRTATNGRDERAALGLYSRDFKATERKLSGKMIKCDYSCISDGLHLALNAAEFQDEYKCKPADAPSAGKGALRCIVAGNAKIAGRKVTSEYDQTFEFGIENGEVKIQGITSLETKKAEVTR